MKDPDKHYTTPAFADTLKEHGIEIDSIFLHYTFEGKPFIGLDMDGMIGCLNAHALGVTHDPPECEELKPAYLISEVLRWLPRNIEATDMEYPKGWHLRGDIDRIWYTDVNNNVFLAFATTPESLIAQGLKEGWLDKETIIKNASK